MSEVQLELEKTFGKWVGVYHSLNYMLLPSMNKLLVICLGAYFMF